VGRIGSEVRVSNLELVFKKNSHRVLSYGARKRGYDLVGLSVGRGGVDGLTSYGPTTASIGYRTLLAVFVLSTYDDNIKYFKTAYMMMHVKNMRYYYWRSGLVATRWPRST